MPLTVTGEVVNVCPLVGLLIKTVGGVVSGIKTKFANSVIGAFIVIDGDGLLPEYDPLPLPVQLLKL